jgi:hypothetical protein
MRLLQTDHDSNLSLIERYGEDILLECVGRKESTDGGVKVDEK